MTMIEYIRDGRGRKVGVMVAYKDGDSVRIGWSKCNTKLEPFDRERGLAIAFGRAVKGNITKKMPNKVCRKLARFIDRADRYYNNPKPRSTDQQKELVELTPPTTWWEKFLGW